MIKRAVTTRPMELEIQDHEDPVPGPGEALLAVESVGICGSDLHLFAGDHPYSRFPSVQGHEFAGTVVAIPKDAPGQHLLGQRVAIEPLITCGVCLPCRRGRRNCCTRMQTFGVHRDGGLAQQIVVPIEAIHPIGDLSADLGALVEPVSIALHALARADPQPGERVVIFGAGPIGLAILLGLRTRDVTTLVIDRLPSRLAIASTIGAAQTVDASRDDVSASVAAWTEGDGPTIAFEATGVPAVMRQAIDVVAPSGTVVVVGLSAADVAIPMIEFTRKELTVVGSRNSLDQFGESITLIRQHAADAERLISHRFPLEEAISAFQQALNEPGDTCKVIVQVRGPS